MKKKYTFIDLFSGAGGLSLGFHNAGFDNVFSLDIDSNFCKTYRKNFPKDIVISGEVEPHEELNLKKCFYRKVFFYVKITLCKIDFS